MGGLAAALTGLAILFATLAIIAGRGAKMLATRRLNTTTTDPLYRETDKAQRIAMLRQRAEDALSHIAGNRAPEVLAQRLKWARISVSPPAWRMLPWASGAVGAVLGMLVSILLPRYAILLPVAMGGLGAAMPSLYLNQRLSARKSRIASEILTYIEYLAMAMGAGAEFTVATQQVADRFPGPVSEAFTAAVLSTNVGGHLDDGLRAAQAVLNNRDADTLIDTIIKKVQLGAECAEHMLNSAASVRREHGERVMEKAGKSAVMLLFPIVIFILPAVFLIVLFPMLHQAISVLH